jgi:hypothetical protein
VDFLVKGNNGGGKPQPYYVQTATILSAVQESREYSDLCVTMTLDIGGTFQPTFRVEGKFAYNAAGEVTGIGSAFKVQALFEKLGINGNLNSTDPINPDMLAMLVGKKIWRLRYAKKYDTTKNKIVYEDYQLIQSGEWAGGEKAVLNAFNKRPPNNYHPELVESQEATSSSEPAPAAEPTSTAPEETPF